MWPNKTDALAYLDGNAAPPRRYARVVLAHRATEEPYYAEIMVGPLPIDNVTTVWEPLDFHHTKKSGGRVRNLDADMDTLYDDWLYKISASIADITLDLWNGTAMGLDNDTIDLWRIDPLWQDDGRVIRWDAFFNLPTGEFDTMTLLPLGLYVMSDVTGRDVSKWKLEGWFYNNVFYETTEAFREAYWSEGFVKNPPNVDGDWAGLDRRGPVPPMDTAHPPILVAPAGSRFAVDRQQKYVEWMDFAFYIGFSRDTGLALYDIRYKGERLLYELSLQEALAHYAGKLFHTPWLGPAAEGRYVKFTVCPGNDPLNSGIAYLDSFYGFGPHTFQLVKGYDCPAHAVYLNTSFYVAETTHTHIDSVCLFEYVSDHPMQRHTTHRYVSATKNVYFVVRAVATVDNYDYTFSYSFFMDGSISVDVRASGYILAAYSAHNHDYGFRIGPALSGSMHDHVLNFKADFDILGTANSAQLMTMTPATVVYPWSKGGRPRNTMTLTRSFIPSERHARLNWAPNAATQLLIVNEDAPNQHGELRGYRIQPTTPAAHLTVHDSSNLGRAAGWANHDVHITRQKDTEPRSAHPLNGQDVADPPVDFSRFAADDEPLRGEDLVVWLNLGMHHVPHSGDLPNTVMTTAAHAGVVFTPSNYFAGGDEGRRTVNQVRVHFDGGEVTKVERFGQFEPGGDGVCRLVFEPADEDLEGYEGDVVVTKFPFEPDYPFFE